MGLRKRGWLGGGIVQVKRITLLLTEKQANNLVSILTEFQSDQENYLERGGWDCGEDERLERVTRQADMLKSKVNKAIKEAK